MSYENKEERNTREGREIWAAKQLAAAKQSWRRFGLFLAIVAIGLICACVYFMGQIDGIASCYSRRDTTP